MSRRTEAERASETIRNLVDEMEQTIRLAVETEREQCAKVAECLKEDAGDIIAIAIRARGKPGDGE